MIILTMVVQELTLFPELFKVYNDKKTSEKATMKISREMKNLISEPKTMIYKILEDYYLDFMTLAEIRDKTELKKNVME